jgi:hypothetical protein
LRLPLTKLLGHNLLVETAFYVVLNVLNVHEIVLALSIEILLAPGESIFAAQAAVLI